ncbi:MAG TPA: acetyl-CoA carboxylase carboxyltransferase subunit alpha [Polyangiaceae bacterium LLY-WYZ-15_(1-7)]|nr:acetyl-CoA carboxylase carboxyl transferase subunit alpha [Sandaracinus sp.]HJL00039.1 acetyl-CoA carboxylase carboxyltransferase subunit alpha [Polyangiaceae bacterium LLY-WYZ-15_(1-7)]MBJ72846.1 acetyl-CoA carboxylase carboxyl transferase subunit alpha [Sandaracinus sp.]HJL12430.1 acetyl-CoA carboxylase carboxyltransferase subunit alpha [Polyangiaceae bacterium LLY-WYZ-15_(1-7)]HJL23643.1 acetyl-CoA carboxylase carboxyltransferase subunit alpha [Polyangiaceae bacterium LLY-WYZ-15_(1-7)]
MAHLEFEKPLVELEQRIRDLKSVSDEMGDLDAGIADQIRELEARADRIQRELYEELSVWHKVQLSRHPDRPYFLDYLDAVFEDFVELHGDRAYADDAALVAGFARFDGRTVAVIGHQKGRSTKEKVKRNFGMAHPEGYRKACRVMELAERFGRPVLTFIDTPGAYPGLGAEERGQSEAIGHSLLVMSRLGVPIIATVIGEGGSGGALALGVANRVLMLQYSTYSVITPEGCASILWRDGARGPDAAEQLKLLAGHAKNNGIVDELVSEPTGGAHRDPADAAERLAEALRRHLAELDAMTPEQRIEQRYAKFRAMGPFVDAAG